MADEERAPQQVTFSPEQLTLIAKLVEEAATKAANAARGPSGGVRYAPRQAVPRRQVQVAVPAKRVGHRIMRDGRIAIPADDAANEYVDPETGELYDSGGGRVGFHLELVHDE